MFFIQLLAILCAIWIGFIAIIVLFNALNRDPSKHGDSIGNTIQEFVRSLITALIAIGIALTIAAGAIYEHLMQYWMVYIALGFAAVGAEAWVLFSSDILSGLDMAFSDVVLQSISKIVLGVLNVIRLMYRTFIVLIYNYLAGSLRVILNVTISLAIDCTAQNWEIPLNYLLLSVEDGTMASVNFILAFGLDDIELNSTFNNFGHFLGSFRDSLDCQCQDLDFLWKFMETIAKGPHYPLMAHYLINTVIEVVRIPTLLFFDLMQTIINFPNNGPFMPPNYGCSESDAGNCATPSGCPQQRYCIAQRNPKIFHFASLMCNTIQESFHAQDHTYNKLFQILIDTLISIDNAIPGPPILPTGIQFPPFMQIIGSTTCVFIHAYEIILDIVFHLDLVFMPDPPVKFLDFIRIDAVVFYSLETCDRVEEFFGGWSLLFDQVLRDLGCILASIMKILVYSIEFLTRLCVTICNKILPPYGPVDPITEIITWMQAYNFVPLENEAYRVANCTNLFIKNLNEAIGNILNIGIELINELIFLTTDLIRNLVPDKRKRSAAFQNYVNTELLPRYKKIIDKSNSFAITMGNYIRQYQFQPIPCCAQRDPVLDLNTPMQYCPDSFMCCLANLVESFTRLIVGFVDVIFDTALELVIGTNFTPTQIFSQAPGTPFNIQEKVLVQVDQFVRNSACAPASFFVYANSGQCLSNPTPYHTVPITMSDTFAVFLNFTVVPFYVLNTVAVTVGKLIANEYVGDILCYFVTSTYDIFWCSLINFFRAGSGLLGCTMPANSLDFLSDFGLVCWEFFGWDIVNRIHAPNDPCDPLVGEICVYNDVTNVRNFLCVMLETLFGAIDVIISFFTDFEQFFADLFIGIGNDIINILNTSIITQVNNLWISLCAFINGKLIGVINNVAQSVTNIISYLTNLKNYIASIFNNFFNDVDDCFTSFFTDCDIRSPGSPPSFSNPAKPTVVPTMACPTIGLIATVASKRSINQLPPLASIAYYFDRDNVTLTFFNENANDTIGNPCAHLLRLFNLNTTTQDMKTVFINDFKNCMTSSMVSRIIDMSLLQMNESVSIVNRDFLTNPSAFLLQLNKFKDAFVNVYTYQTSDTNMTWSDYVFANNLEGDLLTASIGNMVSFVSEMYNIIQAEPVVVVPPVKKRNVQSGDNNNNNNTTTNDNGNNDNNTIPESPFSRKNESHASKIIRIFKTFRHGTKLTQNLYNMVTNPALTEGIKRTVVEINKRSIGEPNIFDEFGISIAPNPMFEQSMNNFWKNMTAFQVYVIGKLNKMAQTNSTEIMHNRMVLLRMFFRVKQQLLWYHAGRPKTWENGLIPPENDPRYSDMVKIFNSYKLTLNGNLDDQLAEFRRIYGIANDHYSKKNRTSSVFDSEQSSSSTTTTTLLTRHTRGRKVNLNDPNNVDFDQIMNDQREEELERIRQNNGVSISSDSDYYYYEKRMNEKRFDVTPFLCIADECLNCTWFNEVVNEIINLGLLTLDDARFYNTQGITPPGMYVPNPNITAVSIAGPQSPTNGIRTPLVGASIILDLVESAYNWVYGSLFETDRDGKQPLNIRQLLSDAIYFITNSNQDDPNGLFFWLKWSRKCDPFEHPRCGMGLQGYGFWNGLWKAIMIFVIIAGGTYLIFPSIIPFLGAIAGPVQGLTTIGFVLMFFPLWFALSYGMSPACLSFFVIPDVPVINYLPIYLPIFPNCLSDDIYSIVESVLGPPCVNFTLIGLPGLTTDVCPASFEQCYNLTSMAFQGVPPCAIGLVKTLPFQRIFVDCTSDPYKFDNIFRNAFYLLYKYLPSFYKYLTTSRHIWVSWIREVPTLLNGFTFDFESTGGTPSDTWNTCNIITSFNLANFGILMFSSAFTIFLLLSSIFAIFVLLTAIVVLFLNLFFELFNRLAGSTSDPNRYYTPEQIQNTYSSSGGGGSTNTISTPASSAFYYSRGSNNNNNNNNNTGGYYPQQQQQPFTMSRRKQ